MIQIPPNQILGFDLTLFEAQMRRVDNTICRQDLKEYRLTVLIAEIGCDPISDINDLVSVVPVREVLIPTNVFFRGLYKDRNVGQIMKRHAIHAYILGQNDVFQRIRSPILPVNPHIRHVGQDKGFQRGR